MFERQAINVVTEKKSRPKSPLAQDKQGTYVVIAVFSYMAWFFYVTGIHYTPSEVYANLVIYYLLPIYILISYLFLKKRKLSDYRTKTSQKKWTRSTLLHKVRYYLLFGLLFFVFTYCFLAFTLYHIPHTFVKLVEGKEEERTTTVTYINSKVNARSCKGTEITFEHPNINKMCLWGKSLTSAKEGDKVLVTGREIYGGFLVTKLSSITSH